MKKRFLTWKSLFFLTLSSVFFFIGCNKADILDDNQPNPNQNRLSVYLTDGPGYFDKVLVDIQGIAVKIDTSTAWWPDNYRFSKERSLFAYCGNRDSKDSNYIWDTLSITPAIYDLLDFANGADTLLAAGNVTKGKIIAFKLVLGQNNSLVKDSVSYPLSLVPGWEQIYIRVFGDNFQKASSNNYKIWLDMDAGKSVIRLHDGKFYLRPVLRAYAIGNTGKIKGMVTPYEAYPVISVFNDTDTLFAIPKRNGAFAVNGLPTGDYTVFINASNDYKSKTITDVSVDVNKTTDIGKIVLTK